MAAMEIALGVRASFISMSDGYAFYAHTAGKQPTPSTWQVTGCKFLCLANAAELA